MQVKLSQTIAKLRRERGISQEELATVLGVTNQAVSKWENDVCCPDIALLPELARYFGTTVDFLLGCESEGARASCELDLASLSREDGLKLVRALHATLLSRVWSKERGWNARDAVAHASVGEWGYSALCEPGFTTVQRRGSAFFSDNKLGCVDADRLASIASVARCFADTTNLRLLCAIFELTEADESRHVTPSEIAVKSGLAIETIASRLEGELALIVRSDGEGWRIRGELMCALPMVMMLCVG